MAHLIDNTTGRNAIAYVGSTPWHGLGAIAYVGSTPWHGLGQQLTADAPLEVWTREAGLDWTVQHSPVEYHHVNEAGFNVPRQVPNRRVLYRSDTLAPLGIVSNDYKEVQPAEVMGFFDELVKLGGFTLETAGALMDGKRIWALAKINDGAPIIGHDQVRPYLLLTTSYDGTLATTAKLTAIRVVCNNTLSISVEHEGTVANGTVKVPHAAQFNAEQVRRDLGVFANDFDKWLINTKRLASQQLDLKAAAKFTDDLVRLSNNIKLDDSEYDARDTRLYKQVMRLFDGEALGAELAGYTRWGWLNAVTQYVDYERGRGDTRLNSAWFGSGDALKTRAYVLVTA